MKRWLVIAGALMSGCGGGGDAAPPVGPSPGTPAAACDAGNGGITLPTGFCATVFANVTGRPRHLAIGASGILYAALSGGGVVALRDTTGDSRADVSATFASGVNTGIAIRGNELFVDLSSMIVRYRLAAGGMGVEPGRDTIVSGLPTGGHGARNIAIDAAGNLFVNVGSIGNACESGVRDPCAELATRAGIWRFSADQARQTFSAAARYATGIRNAVAMAVHPTDGRLWAAQHGRDNLHTQFASQFPGAEGSDNPAEELFPVSAGDDFGWPYCYYDRRANARLLAPDFGGNRSLVGRCAATRATATAFPGHWAPNGLAFYTGTQFPTRYRNGAFVAFHGSHNRTPQPQEGYLVAFVMAAPGNGVATTYEVFADGFKGAATISAPGEATYRPTGLAVGPDGSLYIGDDVRGRIWKVRYTATNAR